MPNTNAKPQNSTGFLIVFVLTTFLVQGAINGIYPAIAALQHQFSDMSRNAVIMLTTLPTLTCVPSMYLVGWFIKKINIKKTVIIGFIVFFIGGLGPLVNSNSYYWILICRAIYGLGYGIGYSICPTLVIAFFKGRIMNRVMGWGTTFHNVGTTLFALVAAALCAISTDLVWWVHALMLLPFVLAFFVKDPDKEFLEEEDKTAQKAEAAESLNGKKPRIPLSCYGIIILVSLITLFFYPLFIYSALFIDQYQLGTTTEASFLSTITAIVGAVGAIVVGDLYNKIGNWLVPFGAVLLMIGSFWVPLCTNSLGMLFVAAGFISIGFWWLYTAIFMIVPKMVHPSLVADVNGYAAGTMNLLAFFAAYVFTFLNKMFGQDNSLTFPFITAGVFFAIVTVGGIIVSFKGRQKGGTGKAA